MDIISILDITLVVVSVLLIFVILIQNKSVSLSLSSMSGGMQSVTKRGPEKIMHNATIVLGALFIANSLALFLLK